MVQSNPNHTVSNAAQVLASGSWDGAIRLWETRSRRQIVQDRRLARLRAKQLAPLVEGWIEKSSDKLVVAQLEQEVKDRTPEEATTLRNLVLKKLVQQRQAKSEVP